MRFGWVKCCSAHTIFLTTDDIDSSVDPSSALRESHIGYHHHLRKPANLRGTRNRNRLDHRVGGRKRPANIAHDESAPKPKASRRQCRVEMGKSSRAPVLPPLP